MNIHLCHQKTYSLISLPKFSQNSRKFDIASILSQLENFDCSYSELLWVGSVLKTRRRHNGEKFTAEIKRGREYTRIIPYQ